MPASPKLHPLSQPDSTRLNHSHRWRTSPLPWLWSKPYHLHRKTMVQPVHAASVLHDAKNRFGTKSSALKILQMYDCCECLGHVSCSLTSFPLFTHSSSTVPLLLEQPFSAGRCPSFPVHHHNCQLYCRCQLQAQGQDLPCLLPVPSSSFPDRKAKSGDHYQRANISQKQLASLLQG